MLLSRKAEITIDRHTIAAISVIDIRLDLPGIMYLVCDLLGGKHGPWVRSQEW